MTKYLCMMLLLALPLSGCGKAEPEPDAATHLQLKADQARLNLQNKADELARNPPPELLEAARQGQGKFGDRPQ